MAHFQFRKQEISPMALLCCSDILLLLVFYLLLATLTQQLEHGDEQAPALSPAQSDYNPPAQATSSCDLFNGSWVIDESYPIYNAASCPFVGGGFDCLKNGRPDRQYLKYRWKPNGCDLARFNGHDLLERYRGEKILFVGDSLSHNQWASLTCMLHTSMPNSNYTFVDKNAFIDFSFPEYGVSVNFIKNGFLIDVVVDRRGRILKLDSISSGNAWKEADVLIFNSYHWWIHKGRYQTWDYFQVGDVLYKNMDHMVAFKLALTTWANWVDANIDFSKTRVFFQGVSAVHLSGKEWGDPKAKDCYGQTKPVQGSTYPGQANPGEEIVKGVIRKMKNPAYLLDITLLTELRKDGHPSIYAGLQKSLHDCSHWCLAGVPDTWNELLYTALLKK